MATIFLRLAFILLIFIIESNNNIYSQSYPLRHYTVDNGLNSNTVYDAVQDDMGFMWFATSAGVSKFDGRSFDRYTVDNGLSDNEVLKIKKDLSGKLWLLSFNGTVTVIDKDSIYNGLTNPLLMRLGPGFFYNHFYVDSGNTVWLSNTRNIYCRINFPDSINTCPLDSSLIFKTHYGGLMRTIEGGTGFINNENRFQKSEAFNRLKHWCYYGDSMFIGLTDSAIITLDKENQVTVFPVEIPNLKNAIDIYCDDHLGIWITSAMKGVYYYEKTDHGYSFYDAFLKGEYVTSTFRDKESNVWFTVHGNGVFMMSSNFKTTKSYTVQNGLQENEVYSVALDSRNRIWVGHKYGVVDVINKDKVLRIRLRNDVSNIGRVLKISEHPLGKIIVSTDIGLFVLDMNNPEKNIRELSFITTGNELRKNVAVKDLSAQMNGDIYLACHENIYFIPGKELIVQSKPIAPLPLPIKRYYASCIDSEGNLWYADFEGLMQLKKGQQISFKKSHPLLSQRITALKLVEKKVLVSILGYGLVVIENEKIIKHITVEDGLLSNHCINLFVKDSMVFVCTNKGLNIVCFKRNGEIEVTQITTANGLLSSQVNDVFVSGSVIYAATLNGISVINYEDEKKRKTDTPKIYFSKVSWQGKNITATINPRISYIDKYIRFDFVSPFFTFPEGVRYQYKLNNSNWIETPNTSLEFNALNPADYTLQVRARHLSSEWSMPIFYSFSILTPFYKAWWFYLILLFGVLLLGFVFYTIRIRAVKNEDAIKIQYEQQINNLQNQSLQAMMNPHFVFNSLNAIKLQINSGNIANATHYLSSFARLLRMNLQTVNEDFIPLKEELQRIRLYFEIEKIRLEDKLNYAIEISPEIGTEDILIPSMIIQPFLENSIWHGIMPKESNGFVKLFVTSNEKQLTIRIEDNGVGINASQAMKKEFSNTKHYGIQLTKERLAFLQKKSNQNVILEITDKSPSGETGTLVTIILPLLSYT